MKHPKIKSTFSYVLLLMLLILSITTTPEIASSDAESILESRILKVGAQAPDISLETLKGEQFELNNHLGKRPILLFFWSFFCGPCREEIPSLQEVYTQVGADRMAFLGINLDGKGLSKAIDKYLEASKLEFVPLFDDLEGVEYKVADPYGVAGTPTAYIIDLDGKIAFAAVGRVEQEELKKILEEILSGS